MNAVSTQRQQGSQGVMVEPRWPSAHGRLRGVGFAYLGPLRAGPWAGSDAYRAPHGGGVVLIRGRHDVVIRTQLADRRVVETRLGRAMEPVTACVAEPDTRARIGGHPARSVVVATSGEVGSLWRLHLQHLAGALNGGVVSPQANLDDVEALWHEIDQRADALRPGARRLVAAWIGAGFFCAAVVTAGLWRAGWGASAAAGMLALPWVVVGLIGTAPSVVSWGLSGRSVVAPAAPSPWSGLRPPEASNRPE